MKAVEFEYFWEIRNRNTGYTMLSRYNRDWGLSLRFRSEREALSKIRERNLTDEAIVVRIKRKKRKQPAFPDDP